MIGDSLYGADPMGADVFGAAYPYGGRTVLMEIYAERYFRPRGALLGVRAGRFRTPFGIYSRSEYGYTGFVRPPLIRYDGYFGVSNNWLEEGAMVTAGVPQLFVEASVSRPHDVGFAIRRERNGRVDARPGLPGAVRRRRKPCAEQSLFVAALRRRSAGVYRRRRALGAPTGVQARGEFLKGHSYEGVSTIGWYVDGIVHRPGMGPFTALVRGEYLDYEAAPPRARRAKRLTLGTRVRWPGPVTLQLNYLRQTRGLAAHQIALDRLQRDVLVPCGSLRMQLDHATRYAGTSGWRPGSPPAFFCSVTLSLAAVVFTATRVTTRSAVARATDNLEGARSAFYRLVDERAEFAARQTRLITELPVFRSMMINPVIAKDVATLTEMAESYRQSLNAQFAIVTRSGGRPSASPGWAAGHDDARSAAGSDSRGRGGRIATRHRRRSTATDPGDIGAREIRAKLKCSGQ